MIGKSSDLPMAERLEALSISEPMSGCHIWLGRTDAGGYGRITVHCKNEYAHRLAFECDNGPIPDGRLVLHRCDNRACINSGHLFLGTDADNVADKVAKGRQAKGERHGQAKLTVEQVTAIRADGGSQRATAARYGVSQSAVSRVRRGDTWAA